MAQRPRIAPLPGQESVWDYPRPPRMEPARRHVRIEFAGEVIAESDRAIRVLETAGAPTYYLPPEDVRLDLLRAVPGTTTYCEWKGTASYRDVVVGDRVAERAAWTYPEPKQDYAGLAGYLSFYPARVDEIRLDDEVVRPQPGRYYGGWVTDDIVGPFKGEAGSEAW
jgi:uncharacterized protein (DUF427 family)